MKPTFIADLHCHTTMRPFYSGNDGQRKTIWEFIQQSQTCCKFKILLEKNLITEILPCVKDMDKQSQACLDQCVSGNVRVVFNSLYPVELPWFEKLIVGDKDIESIIKHIVSWNDFVSCLSGLNPQVIQSRFLDIIYPPGSKQAPFSYFNRLTEEYQFLLSQVANGSENRNATILTCYNDYVAFRNGLSKSGPGVKQIGIIINVEGGHSLLGFNSFNQYISIDADKEEKPDDPAIKEFEQQLVSHINTLKQLGPDAGHAPLYITLSHHYWNLLSGHEPSLPDVLADKQKNGLQKKLTYLGKKAIDLLLEKQSAGRRILIDIKHLSDDAKDEYFEIVKDHRRERDDIPLISSHSAMKGESMDKTRRNHFFCDEDINLRDKDISFIVETEGLIGIMMEQGRLTSKKMIRYIKRNPGDGPRLQAELVIAQVLYIVKVAGYQAWDHICIGSDFDGMITSPSHLDSSDKLNLIFDTLEDIIKNKKPLLDKTSGGKTLFEWKEIEPLLSKYSAEDLINKLAYGNIELFLKSFFNDAYLKSKKV